MVYRVRIKKYRSYKGEVGKIAPNLLNRDFHAENPNQKWVTDVTEFSLFGQKLYLSPILDLHDSYLVSYAISDRPVLNIVTTMLDNAFETIPDGTDLILHSDQGWQYQHKEYQRVLSKKGHPAEYEPQRQLLGQCGDGKLFSSCLKASCFICKSMEHFKQELVDYLEDYNARRIRQN